MTPVAFEVVGSLYAVNFLPEARLMMNFLKHTATRTCRLATSALGLALIFSAFSSPAKALFDAPEVDPGSMASALTLLAGGVLTLTGRVRRNLSK